MTKKNLIPKSKAKTAYGLLSEVCEVITEEPKRYYQGNWRESGNVARQIYGASTPACGTVCCVAGWAVTLTKPRTITRRIEIIARRLLGLSSQQSEELFAGDALFFTTSATPQTPEYAAAGVQHIRAFQKKYAKQLKAKRV